jgi:hypothetical protein
VCECACCCRHDSTMPRFVPQVLPFFESMGFKLPERKGIADFLQEVTSPKDQAVGHTPSCCPSTTPIAVFCCRPAFRRPA